MSFDPTNPLDNSLVSVFPANERASRQAIEDAFNTEHDDATGRHVFGVGTTATRNGASGVANGMIWFNTDRVAGEVLVDIRASGAWVETSFGLLDVVQKWTKTQYGTPNTITPGAGAPNTLDWATESGAFFKATLTADTILNHPTDTLAAGDMSNWIIQIQQDAATGGHELTFESPYFVPAFGGQPDIAQGVSERTFIHITKIADASLFRYLYRVEPHA